MVHARKLLAVTLAVLATVGSGQPALAQAWIGEMVGNMMAQQQAAANEAACMNGAAPVEKERLEALEPSNLRLHAYHRAMQGNTAPRSAFFVLDKKTSWVSGSARLDRSTIDQGTDPFAAAGMTLAEQPHAFHRSYLDASALGQWAVRDQGGAVVGVYNAFLVRKSGEWMLRTLTLEDAASYTGPVMQFCHQPGDVLPYRIKSARMMQEYHGGRLAKAQTRLISASTAQAKAQAASASRPDNAAAAARLAKADAQVAKWNSEIAERKAGLYKADADLAAALADEAALPALRDKARQEFGIGG